MKKIIKIIIKILTFTFAFLAILFVHFYIINSGDYKVAKTVAQDPGIPHIEIKGTVFHTETFGSDTNEVVIVIHGGPGNDYRNLLSLKELSDEYFVVFYDQRGTGLSPRVPAEELTLKNMLNDLDNIIEYYAKDRKVNLIGHSLGAMLATGYITKNPKRVNKAVLAEPEILTKEKAVEFIEKTKPEISFAYLRHLGKCWFQSLYVNGPDKQASVDYFFMSFSVNTDPSLLQKHPFGNYYCNEDLNNASLDYWRYSYVSNKVIFQNSLDKNRNLQIELVNGLEKFNNKVLFITGECNTLIGKEYQKDHMKHFPNAEMIVIKNAGHTIFGEQPEESIAHVRKYFSED